MHTRKNRCFFVIICLAIAVTAADAGETTGDQDRLLLKDADTALISGFRKEWNEPRPGELLFDGVHRNLLVRFPKAAEKIAGKLKQGYRIKKAELLLPFDGTDFGKGLYELRTSFGGAKLYKQRKPRWHAVGWAIKKPWAADAELGPTFNAYIKGAGYWKKFGARSAKDDRVDRQFGPVEVSYFQAWHKPDPVLDNSELAETSPLKRSADNIEKSGVTPEQPFEPDSEANDPEVELDEKTIDPARMDVTASLTNPAFGKSLAKRLRRLSDCGFLLQKWETYDWRYRVAGQGAYEWQVAVGGGALHIQKPSLEVTFTQNENPVNIDVPPPVDIPSLAKTLKKENRGGQPTASIPGDGKLDNLIAAHQIQRADWMPEWQWKRVQELDDLGGGYRMPSSRKKYLQWIDGMLNDPPRYWNGWDVHDRLLTYFLYRDALPRPVREHYFHDYWKAWLMCWMPTDKLEHPQAVELRHDGKNKYYNRTGDWRGNASFYRDGYCYNMGTMNFNHTSAMGALLGGGFTDCQRAVRDGRHGLEQWPLRTWCWYDGSTQESIDHYYFAITLSGQKMFADFGPTHLDRLMGKSILAKSVGEITSAYHPALRHFIASSGRTNMQYVLLTQDGLQHIVHTLSRKGSLHDVNNDNLPDTLRTIGRDVPPGRVAQQTATGAWAPAWVSNMVDQKPIPFSMTCAYKEWGHHARNPLWRRTYLGENYGLGSTDLHWGVVQVLGQWRREPAKPVTKLQEIGIFTIRCGVNETRLVNSHSGWMPSEGNLAVFQEKNKMIAVGSPYRMDPDKMGAYINTKTERPKQEIRPGEPATKSAGPALKSLQTTVGFFNYQKPRTWQIYVNGEPVSELPFTAEHGQRITIRDGASYIGLIPLPGGPPASTNKVVIKPGNEQTGYPKKIRITPTLVIDSYSYFVSADAKKSNAEKLDALINEDVKTENDNGPNMNALDHSYSGFVVEMGDETEYDSFEDFQRHFAESELKTRWQKETKTVHVSWKSGATRMEAGVKTDYKKGGASPKCWAYRRVNEKWPYLAEDMDRDTTLTQQGRCARLEKQGAVLVTDPERMAYLQAEPVSGTYCGWNPLPDMTMYRLVTPEGIRLETDGRTGLTRVIVQPKNRRIELDHALKSGQSNRGDLAKALMVFGMEGQPTVFRNGRRISPTPAARPPQVLKKKIGEKHAWVIPLREEVTRQDLGGVAERYQHVTEILDMIARGEKPDIADTVVQDWWVIGPFSNKNKKGFSKAYPPEKKVDLAATYQGVGGKTVAWKRTQPADKPPLGRGPINLKKLFDPAQNVCAYAFTEIESDHARDATLYVGSDDTIIVWINGDQVLSREVYRGAALDQDQTSIHLQEGTNRVLVKICQTWGGWEFYFRIGDVYGLPIEEGLKFGVSLPNK
ncbi:MAG: hypothetical protein KGZ25_03430 [Planctomycetes bacterium]|nr:hypothetical protein [Planctomycetota bacterium]